MGKVIRLKENDIQHIVKRVLKEQEEKLFPYIEVIDNFSNRCKNTPCTHKIPSNSSDNFSEVLLNDDLINFDEGKYGFVTIKIPKRGNYQLLSAPFGGEKSVQIDNIKGNSPFKFIFQHEDGGFSIIDKKTGDIVYSNNYSL